MISHHIFCQAAVLYSIDTGCIGEWLKVGA
jgi:hypothetical protein